ncbi:MAG TPA: hypothetical protein VF225_08270 [Gaiellaceae bacterium]
MTPPEPAVLSPAGDPLTWVDAWARSPDLARVVAAFGGETSGQPDLGAWLAYLEAFSQRWDYRAGQERNLVKAPDFTPDLTAMVFAAATVLGMRGTTAPAREHYEHVVILGGLVRACLARPRHAANLLDAGTITADRIIALGGFRPLKGDEETLVAELLDTSVTDEYHAMRAGVEAAFGLGAPVSTRGEPSEVVGASWGVTDYVTAAGVAAHVVAAPSSEPGVRRANTPDTYAWLARDSTWLRRGDAVLLVTTDIYAPYQGADAIRMLAVPHGVEVDVVGIEPGGIDPRLAQPFAVHNYLQELRSTIRSLRMLHSVLTG